MNEKLRTKTDDFRKRAPIPHYSFFILHYSLSIVFRLQRQRYAAPFPPCRLMKTYEEIRRNKNFKTVRTAPLPCRNSACSPRRAGFSPQSARSALHPRCGRYGAA